MIRFPIFGIFAYLLLCEVVTMHAHDPFESWSMARLSGDELLIQTTISVSSVPDLIVDLEEIDLEKIDLENFDSYKLLLIEYAPKLFYIAVDEGDPLRPIKIDVSFIEEDYDIQIRLRFKRPENAGVFLFEARYLERMGEHVGTIYIEDEFGVELAWSDLTSDFPFLEVAVPSVGIVDDSVRSESPPTGKRFRKFLSIGVEHIFSGFDHLLFLMGLLIVCRRYSTMAIIISCFTIAHSITLGLSALDLFSLPGEIVEPLIAASIVYVGLENLFRQTEARARWTIAFLFGLVHGFGFAGALKQTGLGSSGSGLLLPLFSFNLGVELGQIVVAILFLAGLWLLNKQRFFERYGPRILSSIVACVGGYWLLQRTLFS